MDRVLLRTWAPRLVLLLVAIAFIPLTIARTSQGSREAALARQLGDLRREARRTEARLARELRLARNQAQRLRAGLDSSRAEAASLRSELADARASQEQLARRLEETAEVLRNEPPALGLRIAPSDPFSGLIALADNAGTDSIRIIESQGRLWIGGREALLPAGDGNLVIARGEELDVFEFPLLDPERGPVASGDLDLRGALCVVYRREGDASSVDWAREVWFERRPQTGGLALLRQDHWPPGPGEVACDLASAEPPW